MSVTIRSWIDGRAVYVARGAADVRAALVEAAAKGADLQGAYLQGADLRSADLQGAYLQGAYLQGADLQGAYLQGADLQGADLRSAYLRSAYLQGADLQGAYLQGADLQGADLRSAYLQGAYLQGADLQGADGLTPARVDDLRILLDQPGRVRAYKLVNDAGEGPQYGGIKYVVGNSYAHRADTAEAIHCSYGINLATLPWCANAWAPGYRILVAEFTAKDIAAIPYGTDGKFRVHRCRIVAEKDLTELGLIEKEQV